MPMEIYIIPYMRMYIQDTNKTTNPSVHTCNVHTCSGTIVIFINIHKHESCSNQPVCFLRVPLIISLPPVRMRQTKEHTSQLQKNAPSPASRPFPWYLQSSICSNQPPSPLYISPALEDGRLCQLASCADPFLQPRIALLRLLCSARAGKRA